MLEKFLSFLKEFFNYYKSDLSRSCPKGPSNIVANNNWHDIIYQICLL